MDNNKKVEIRQLLSSMIKKGKDVVQRYRAKIFDQKRFGI